MKARVAFAVGALALAAAAWALLAESDGRFPGWVETPRTIQAQIRKVEDDCKHPARDVVQWEVCSANDRKVAWIYYPGEHSAYDLASGRLEFVWVGYHCERRGSSWKPWEWERSCGRSSVDFGDHPGCGGTPPCDPDGPQPCAGTANFGCAAFPPIKEELN